MPQDSMAAEGRAHSEQNVSLSGRRTLHITGVEDIVSFDESAVVMKSTLGLLSVEGEALRILRLNTEGAGGEVIVEGRVNGLFYTDDAPAARGGFFRRRRE